MIDETITTRRARPGQRPSALRLPVQAQPVDRSQARTSAAAGEGGVEADFGWSDVWDVAKVALPAVLGAVSDRRRKRDIVPVAWTR